MKYGFVYIWFDRKHKRYYIGSHWGTEDDGYVCSSSWMSQAYKIRPHDFKRRIVSKVYTNRTDLLEEEYRWLTMIEDSEIASKKYYNRTKHKNGHWCSEDYEKDIRKRISQKTREAMQREDVRNKIEAGYKIRDNRSSDPEVRRKRSESLKGKPRTDKEAHAARLKIINSQKFECKVCKKMTNRASINKFHNDNCKMKALV